MRFRTIEALKHVEEFADNLFNVSITLEDDNTYAFFGNGKIIAHWIVGTKRMICLSWYFPTTTANKRLPKKDKTLEVIVLLVVGWCI